MYPLPKLVDSYYNFQDIPYSKEIVGEIVYLFLFSDYNTQGVQKRLLLCKQSEQVKYDVETVIFAYGLNNIHLGMFAGTSVESAIDIMEKQHKGSGYQLIAAAINDFISFHRPIFSGSGDILNKQVGKSQYKDGVRINQSHQSIFNSPESASYVERGKVRGIYLLLNGKIFPAVYRHENQSDKNVHLERIGFNKAIASEFELLYPNHTGIFSIEMGQDDCHFTIRTQSDMNDDEMSDISKRIIIEESPDDSTELEKRILAELEKDNEDSEGPSQTNQAVNRYQSNPILKERIKQLYGYKCQICGTQIKKLGWREGMQQHEEFMYLVADAHHITPLSQGGKDKASNIICVCPNCHRRLHTGEYLLGYDEEDLVYRNSVTNQYKQFQIKHHIIISGQ